MPTRTNRGLLTPYALRVRADLLAYLAECKTTGTEPGPRAEIAARLGVSQDAIIRCTASLRREGLLVKAPIAPIAERVRNEVLDYLTECVQTGTDPGMFSQVAAHLGLSLSCVVRCIGDLRRDGEIDYAWKHPRWGRTLTVRGITPTVVGGARQCVRCSILCRHLDRAGYCCMCQIEVAYGKPYRPGMAGIRVRVEGMNEPEEPALRERGQSILAPDWPTRGVLQEVRL